MSTAQAIALVVGILALCGLAALWVFVAWEQIRWDRRTRDAPWNQKNWKR